MDVKLHIRVNLLSALQI